MHAEGLSCSENRGVQCGTEAQCQGSIDALKRQREILVSCRVIGDAAGNKCLLPNRFDMKFGLFDLIVVTFLSDAV